MLPASSGAMICVKEGICLTINTLAYFLTCLLMKHGGCFLKPKFPNDFLVCTPGTGVENESITSHLSRQYDMVGEMVQNSQSLYSFTFNKLYSFTDIH